MHWRVACESENIRVVHGRMFFLCTERRAARVARTRATHTNATRTHMHPPLHRLRTRTTLSSCRIARLIIQRYL